MDTLHFIRIEQSTRNLGTLRLIMYYTNLDRNEATKFVDSAPSRQIPIHQKTIQSLNPATIIAEFATYNTLVTIIKNGIIYQ